MSLVFAGAASADNYSFTGTFTTDDQLQEFLFTIGSSTSFTAVTLSYAGGINQAGTTIPEGGFDPYLAIFNSIGTLVAVDDDGTGFVPTDPTTGAASDSYLSYSTFAAGTYTLVLSQTYNEPYGPTFADGYSETGIPDYTAASFGCSSGYFCDPASTTNRTGNWAVDIDNVRSASEFGEGTTTPEPESILLFGSGITGLMILLWRSRFKAAYLAG
jgi:hypothetical protein